MSAELALISRLEHTITQSLQQHGCGVVSSEASPSLSDPLALAPSSTLAPADMPCIAVAYSGGLDSSVLLHVTQRVADALNVRVVALHVHHGISDNADAWEKHCQDTAQTLGVAFASRRITLTGADKTGVEEAARVGRYAALGDMCREHQATLLLTAHHQDDLAETVLLHLLRGTGIAGLSGMDDSNLAPDLLGDNIIRIVRPILHVSRQELEAVAATLATTFVEDESNADVRYTRNALRHHVMPVLMEHFTGFQQRFTRAAKHAQSAQRLLTILAEQDLAACTVDGYLLASKLATLDQDRQENLLRQWFVVQHYRMPSTAWLSELRVQLIEAGEEAQLCVTHPQCEVHRYRDRVYTSPRRALPDEEMEPATFVWEGQASVYVKEYSGTLHFERAETGLDPVWLQAQTLQLTYRLGGERLKLAHNRPTKTVKYHYQAQDIPAWERPFLPFVRCQGDVLYAAGVGMDIKLMQAFSGEQGIVLRWQADQL